MSELADFAFCVGLTALAALTVIQGVDLAMVAFVGVLGAVRGRVRRAVR